MKSNFYFNYSLCNIYIKPSIKTEVSSQILYGEKFSILSKKKGWIKIKTNYDKYIGYIKNKKFIKNFSPTHKVFRVKTQIFKKSNKKFIPINKFLYFASRITFHNHNNGLIEFEKNKWLRKSDLKKINHIERDYLKILKLFLKTKYLWGGKTYKGIDCSAILQLFFFYNNKFYPRDTKDQIKYLRRNAKSKIFKKGDIIFWKGHVAICLNSKKLIHAYGPEKKVLIMPIIKTIERIKRTANLSIKKISSIKY